MPTLSATRAIGGTVGQPPLRSLVCAQKRQFEKERQEGSIQGRMAATAKHDLHKKGRDGETRDFGAEFKNELFEAEEVKKAKKEEDQGWGTRSDLDRKRYRVDRMAGRR